MAKWYFLQGSSEPVPITGRVERQDLKHTLSFEWKSFRKRMKKLDGSN